MNRFSIQISAAVAILLAVAANRLAAAEHLDEEKLKVALHTATPEDEGFIAHVLDLVDNGTLPEDMLNSTFLWAKKKTRNKFQYFKRGLLHRAALAGIDLNWPPKT